MTALGATEDITGKIELPADRSTGPTGQKVKVVIERKFLKKPGERDKDKTPQENILRTTDTAEIHIEYLQRRRAAQEVTATVIFCRMPPHEASRDLDLANRQFARRLGNSRAREGEPISRSIGQAARWVP